MVLKKKFHVQYVSYVSVCVGCVSVSMCVCVRTNNLSFDCALLNGVLIRPDCALSRCGFSGWGNDFFKGPWLMVTEDRLSKNLNVFRLCEWFLV